MRRHLDRRWMAPALCLLCLLLQTPVERLCSALFSGVADVGVGYYMAAMTGAALLWLPPALLLLPWRTRRLAGKQASWPALLLAFPLGLLLQWGLACLRMLLPTAANAMPAPQTPLQWVLAILGLAVAPALCEEAFFRGGLLSHLRDVTSPIAAFVLCTCTFALMHGSLSGLAAHLLVSAACTLLMLGTGSVLPAMLLHLGYNLTALLLTWLPLAPGLTLLLIVPIAALLLLCRHMRWQSSEKHLSPTDITLMAAVLIGCAAQYLPR